MPQHIHMFPKAFSNNLRYIVKKILVLNSVALTKLCDEIYVIPLKIMIFIGFGVSHT